jgi:hypothetical protein
MKKASLLAGAGVACCTPPASISPSPCSPPSSEDPPSSGYLSRPPYIRDSSGTLNNPLLLLLLERRDTRGTLLLLSLLLRALNIEPPSPAAAVTVVSVLLRGVWDADARDCRRLWEPWGRLRGCCTEALREALSLSKATNLTLYSKDIQELPCALLHAGMRGWGGPPQGAVFLVANLSSCPNQQQPCCGISVQQLGVCKHQSGLEVCCMWLCVCAW